MITPVEQSNPNVYAVSKRYRKRNLNPRGQDSMLDLDV